MRSGEYSADRRFDPESLFEVIANTESAEQAANAMQQFVARGDGAALGEVTEVVHLPGNDLLSVRRQDGREALFPFVAEIVPVVDVAGGRVVVTPPDGLLDLDAPTDAAE
jgi:hypothetical protein